MKRIFFLGLISLSLLSQRLVFSAPHWEFAGWYGGSCYPNVEFDPNVRNRVYLVSESAGIWRSDDLGENWYFINEGLGNFHVAWLAVAPSDSNILYAGARRGLYRSKDGGGHWEACDLANGKIVFDRPQNYRSIAISKKDPASLVIGTLDGSVFYSGDYGSSWGILGLQEKPLGAKKPITAMQFNKDEASLYIASEDGLALYSYQNQSWKLFSGGPKGITDFFVSGQFPKKIFVGGQNALYISNNGGETWQSSNPISKGKIYRLAIDESNGHFKIFVVGNKDWYGAVYFSEDEGNSWKSVEKKVIADVKSNPTRAWAKNRGKSASLKINPFDSSVLFRTDWWGVFRSDDGGVTWREKIKGAPTTVGSDIQISDRGIIYVATMDDGLLKSSDFGKTYKALIPKETYELGIAGHIWRILLLGKDRLLATSSPWQLDFNQVFVCDEVTENCAPAREGLPLKRPVINTIWKTGLPRAVAVDPNNSGIIYLGIDGDDGGGLFISRDSGLHWERSEGQPGSVRIYNGLAVDPTNPARIIWGAVGDEGGVYLSEDGGKSWNYVFKSMRAVFDLAVTKRGTIYAAGQGKGPSLYVSDDHGKSWKLLKQFSDKGTCEAIAIHPENDKIMALSTVFWDESSGERIYLTKDGGQSWNDITGDLPNGHGAAAMVFSKKDSSLYLNRYSGSVYKLKID